MVELEEELAPRVGSPEDLHELVSTAGAWHRGRSEGAEEARAAMQELVAAARLRREDAAAPRSLGPLAAVALQHPAGHEVVLLGTLHSAFFRKGESPVADGIRSAIGELQPGFVVVELDEDRAQDDDLFPQRLRERCKLIACQPPGGLAESGGGLSLEDPVLMKAFEVLGSGSGVRGLKNLHSAFLHVWEKSSDDRLFENNFYLGAYEAHLRGDFARDMHSTVEAAAALGVPLVLGDVPVDRSMSAAALERTRAAFAASRAKMRRVLKHPGLFVRFETARRSLTRATMTRRGGGDLELLMRGCQLLEPPGAAYEQMLQALTEQRDPCLAAALAEPAALAALEAGPQGASPPLAVAVLGAGHLPGVTAQLLAAGCKPLPAPSRGWPRMKGGAARPAPGKASPSAGARPGRGPRRGRPGKRGYG